MSYYWFNNQELLKKAKEKYHNNGGIGKAAEHYLDNKDVLKEKAKNVYRNLSEEEKEVKRLYSKDRYNKLKEKLSKVIKMRYWFNKKRICFLQYKR